MKIGNREFDIYNNTYIMGIVNVTPDSFSDGGRFLHDRVSVSAHGVTQGKVLDMDAVLRTCGQMINEGADILDIGGESTRPDADTVSVTEELERVIPVIEAIGDNYDIPVSVDTYKAGVAERAVEAGARLINDIWGLKGDEEMAGTVSRLQKEYDGVALCIMHNRRPVTMAGIVTDTGVPVTRHGEDTDYGYRRASNASDNADYSSADEDLFIEDVKDDLSQSIMTAVKAGTDAGRIIIDPGVGFAKTYEQNLCVIKRIDELEHIRIKRDNEYEYIRLPILLGCSRKSVIGKTLDLPVDRRLNGTLATTAYAALKGVSFVRVHDVRDNAEVIRMLKAIYR